jgi:hypothetical protein
MGGAIYLLKILKSHILPDTNTFWEILSLFIIIGIAGSIYLISLILTKAAPFNQFKNIIKQKLKGKI